MKIIKANGPTHTLRNGLPVNTFVPSGRQNRIINDNGEFNAYSKKELVEAIGSLIQASNSGELVNTTKVSFDTDDVKTIVANMVKTGSAGEEARKTFAADLGDIVYETGTRTGFARSYLKNMGSLSNGEFPQIWRDKNQTYAVVLTGDGGIDEVYMRFQREILPEFKVQSKIAFDEQMMLNAPANWAESKYNEMLRSIMLAEDRFLYSLWKRSTSLFGRHTIYNGGYTYSHWLNQIKTLVYDRGFGLSDVLIAGDVWFDIVSDTEFLNAFSEIQRHEAVLTGRLGSLASGMGVEFYTDSFRDKDLRVLNPGDVISLASPEIVGRFYDRGALRIREYDKMDDGETGNGIFAYNYISMAIVQPNGVTTYSK